MGDPEEVPEEPSHLQDDLAPLRMSSETAKRLKIRQESIIPIMGKEGADIERLLYKGRSMAVFTSGGDSQGKSLGILDSH